MHLINLTIVAASNAIPYNTIPYYTGVSECERADRKDCLATLGFISTLQWPLQLVITPDVLNKYVIYIGRCSNTLTHRSL